MYPALYAENLSHRLILQYLPDCQEIFIPSSVLVYRQEPACLSGHVLQFCKFLQRESSGFLYNDIFPRLHGAQCNRSVCVIRCCHKNHIYTLIRKHGFFCLICMKSCFFCKFSFFFFNVINPGELDLRHIFQNLGVPFPHAAEADQTIYDFILFHRSTSIFRAA